MATKKVLPKKKPVPIRKDVLPAKQQKTQHVTVDLSDSTKELIEKLIAVLSPVTLTEVVSQEIKASAAVVVDDVDDVDDVTPAPVKPSKQAKKSDDKEVVSLSKIRELIQQKAADGKTDAIIRILKKHGTSNATNLDEDEYEGFYNDLKAAK